MWSSGVVMQQAAAAGIPVESILKELIRRGVVTSANLPAAVTAATQWAPDRAAGVVQIAIQNGMAPADAVVSAIAGSPRAAGPAVQAALVQQGLKDPSPEAAKKILTAAYTSALGQTREITEAARRAGISPDVIASAQPWNLPVTSAPSPSPTTASSSNISVSPFSTPSAGGGGGGGSASPN